jgi:uncharacterized protein
VPRSSDPTPDYGDDYCRISVGGSFFIYDSITNDILQLSKELYDAFPAWKAGESIKDENVRKKFDRAVIKGQFGKSPPVLVNPISISRDNSSTDISNVSLCVTEKCNLRCAYCTYGGRYHSQKTMPIDIAKQAVDLISPNQDNTSSIGFYGGEPLLVPSLVKKIVNHAKKRFHGRTPQFIMTTNGTAINHEVADFLIKNDFGLLISLDGPEKIHNRYRVTKNDEGTYRSVIKTLLLFKQLSKDYFESRVRVNIVLAPPIDVNSINAFFTNQLPVSVTRCSISLVNSSDITFSESEPYSDDDYTKLNTLRIAAEDSFIAGDLSINPLSILFFSKPFRRIAHRNNQNISGRRFVPAGQCKPGAQKVYVDVNGNLHICERVGENNPIGSVRVGIDTEMMKKTVDPFFADSLERCSGCFAKRMCGMCISRTLDHGRYSRRKRAAECEIACKFLAKNLQSYLRIIGKNPNAFKKSPGFISQISYSVE